MFDWFKRNPRAAAVPTPPVDRIKPSRVAPVGVAGKKRANGPVRRIERTFAAAEQDRLTAGFAGVSLTADQALVRDLRTMRIRARQLAQDYQYAKRFLYMLKQNVVGTVGIKLRSEPRRADGRIDQDDKKSIERAWRRWSKRGQCTVDRQLSWADVQRLAMETIGRDGEVIIRTVSPFDNEFNYALQVLEGDHLDEDRNRSLPNGWAIHLSVEQNEWGEPKFYHISTRHPGEREGFRPQENALRVPASQVLHPYIVERPTQSRGIPWMHAVIRQASILSGYQEAELVHARAASSKMGFITTPAGEYETGDGGLDDDTEGTQVQDFEPGAIEVLAEGQQFQGFDPTHPTTAYGSFVKDVLRGFAAGLNVSYHNLANDLESVNFSSSRAGILDERDYWRLLQGWFCEQVCQPVFDGWLPAALTVGAIKNDAGVALPPRRIEKFSAVRWQGRGWAWVKPLEDTQAQAAMVASGFKTASDVVEEMTGENLSDVYEQLAEEQRMREDRGLTATVKLGATGFTVAGDGESESDQAPASGANAQTGADNAED